jgi:glutathione S-transferase
VLALYHAGTTTSTKKVRLCLAEKGVAYESHRRHLEKFEHHAPDYVRLNPNGVMPTLVHDGKAIIESTVINEYLDEVFPDPPLKPEDALGRARMRVFCKMTDEFALPALRIPNWTRSKTWLVKAMNEEDFARLLAETPLIDHRMKLIALRGEGFGPRDFAEAEGKMDYVCTRCEAALADGPYLAGATYSLADIAMLPYIEAFAALHPALVANRKLLQDWRARLFQRQTVQAVYPPAS